MTFVVGLTGSIGMGKSTTARFFADAGCDLWDADAAVHRLYDKGGAAVGPLSALFPQALVDGAISRERLRDVVARDETALPRIEEIVHPLVAEDRAAFLETASSEIVVLDMPLLFETGYDRFVDAVVVVTIDPSEQMRRLRDRGRMTKEEILTLLAKQMPDMEKRSRADHIVVTDTLDHARAQVHDIMAEIKKSMANA